MIARVQLQKESQVVINMTPFSPLKVSRRFGGACHLNPQRRRINQARNQYEVGE
jgi:hypothetical protein